MRKWLLHVARTFRAAPDALGNMTAAVRYPDALVTCSKVEGDARVVPSVVVVFEMLSPSTGRYSDIRTDASFSCGALRRVDGELMSTKVGAESSMMVLTPMRDLCDQ